MRRQRLVVGVPTESRSYRLGAAHDPKRVCAGSPGRYDISMLQALRPEDALAIAEISRRRNRDEQAMAQYLGIGRGAHANGAAPEGTFLRLSGDVVVSRRVV